MRNKFKIAREDGTYYVYKRVLWFFWKHMNLQASYRAGEVGLTLYLPKGFKTEKEAYDYIQSHRPLEMFLD